MTFVASNLEGTKEFAAILAGMLKAGDVIGFKGGMGAGKTTLTRFIVEALGIKAEVSSPTFAIINEYYGSPLSVFHFDMYRVANAEDLYSTGFYDYLDRTDGINIIEWSENISEQLPDGTIYITIETDPNAPNKRTFNVAGGIF